MNSPCYKCKDREIGCHCECEKYKEFRENIDKIKKEKQMQKATSTPNYLLYQSSRRFTHTRNGGTEK